MAVCKNCTFEFEGKFCPQCGQKAKTKRITLKTMWEEVRKSAFHYDQGFSYTVKQLLRRPGHAVREYLEGKRVDHIKPVKFLLWTTAINFLIFHLLGLDKEMINSIAEQQGQQNMSSRLTQYIFDHPAILILALIPNISLFSWLFFRSRGYNYAEHFVLNAYLMGAVSLFGVITNPLMKLMGPGNALFPAKLGLSMFVWFGFVGWGYTQFFQPPVRKWLTWLKVVLAVFAGYILLLLIFTVLLTAAIVLFEPWVKPFLKG